jgi:EAL domain-containing protein (putative c-di-GMP-specific phosphodiesterase class I)
LEYNIKREAALRGIKNHDSNSKQLDDAVIAYDRDILPISSIKIDKSFIKDINDKTKREIVTSISNIAHSIGLKVVAEGVESEQEFTIIRSLGLEMMQGYYVSRPIPKNEIEAKLLEMNFVTN